MTPSQADPTQVARRLRRDQTGVERLLWGKLRDRRLGGWKFRRQMPISRYVVDFCCPDAWLAVELDGGQHSQDAVIASDEARRMEIERGGYLVVRFWNRELIENLEGVCETILRMCEGGGEGGLAAVVHLTPALSPAGRGGASRLFSRSGPRRRGAGNPLPCGERPSRAATG